jgi:FkbM family methyltransferase
LILFNIRKNMSFYHYVTSPFEYLRYMYSASSHYWKTYKNFVSVMYKKYLKKFPIKVILKNGEKMELKFPLEVQAVANGFQDVFDVDSEILIIKKSGIPEVKLIGWQDNGDVFGVFFDEYLSEISFKGKNVIDIGANIADSVIYFAFKGAQKIIALEPMPTNYEIAKKNIELNNLGNKVELVLAGCGGKSGIMNCDVNNKGIEAYIDENIQKENSKQVPIITLEEILKKYNVTNSPILKMDCEGHEYEIILSASEKTLNDFSEILLEYHYGYKNLKEKLEQCGFKVKVDRPATFRTPLGMHKRQFMGLLHAKK